MKEYTADELREMDAVIAEKVMGWKWRRKTDISDYPDGWAYSHLTPDEYAGYDGWMLAEDDAPRSSTDNFILPRYTTDPAAKWSLLQTLIDDGALVILEQPVGEPARVDIRTRYGDKLTKRNASMYAATIEVALALAVLAATESKPDGESV